MKKVDQIIRHLQSVDQMLMSHHSPFYPNRRLSPDAEEFLSEEAAIHPYHSAINLKLFLAADESNREHEIKSAIHQHFAYRKEKSEIQLKQTLKLGWRSLLISI